MYVIWGFQRKIDEIWAVLEYYAAYSEVSLPTFRGNLSVPSSRDPVKMGPIGCPETSVMKYHYTLRKYPGRAEILQT
jgi:hypothetical protein